MNFLQDIRFALRTFARTPVFAVVAVLSLALGIGANTAIFTLTDQVLIRTLPVNHPEQLVMLTARGQHYGGNMGPNRISYPMYQDFRDRSGVFTSMFCFRETNVSLEYRGRTERVSGELVSGNYFPVLGLKAVIGRLFTSRDDEFQGAHPLVVLSFGFWESRFASDPRVIGQKLIINGYPFTIIGVSQPGFSGTDPAYAPQLRIPMSMSMKIVPYFRLNDRRSRWVTAFGRMKPGMSLLGARASLQPFFHQILRMEVQQKEFAKASPYMKQAFLRMSMDVLPGGKGRSQLRNHFFAPLVVLMATVGVVLLIACANVANLLIARMSARQKEIALRLALGSSRRRVVCQLLVETLILSLTGGSLGLAFAIVIDHALIAFLPSNSVPLSVSSVPDWRILTFNLVVSVLTGIAFGLLPALQSTRPDLVNTLKDEASAVVGGQSTRMRKALVIAQVSLSLLLLIGAGLFTRSLRKLKDLDPGFRTSNLLAFKVDPVSNGYKPERVRAFYQRLKQSLTEIPAIESASLAVMPVLEGDEWDQWVTIDAYSPKTGELPDPHMNSVFPDYFATMQIPILVGRDFRLADTLEANKVCIVNEVFAKKYFGTANAIGRKIGMGIDPGTKTDITIVGVVRSTRYEGMREQIPLEVFRPYDQLDYSSRMTAYIRTTQKPDQIFTTVRKRVSELDQNVPVFDMVTIEQQMDDSLVTERLIASLSTGFGLLATLLASIGLYGVMAYSVLRRTREIGIRMAVGAERRDVLWLVLREVLILLAIGISVALPTAGLLTRYVRSQLYGIDATDPLSILAATACIGVVAVLSGYLPARRATLVDPMCALRYE